MPAGTAYESLTGRNTTLDLRDLADAYTVVDHLTRTVEANVTLDSLVPTGSIAQDWLWIYSMLDVQGNKANQGWEQAPDQFQMNADGGQITVRGRTQDWLRNIWGEWRNGTANVFAIGLSQNDLYYYVRVN